MQCNDKIIRYILLFFKKMHNDILMIIGAYGFLTLIVFSLFSDWIAPYGLLQRPVTPFLPSAWSDVGDIAYFFGTDNLGRDILSRIIYGTKATFGSSLLITLIVGLVGMTMGIGAGVNRGLTSAFLKHVFDVFLAIPCLVLMIIFIVFVGPSLQNAIIAIAFSFLPRFIHNISNAIRDELDKEYIVALRLDGASTFYILKDSILPNMTPVIVSEHTRILSMGILYISTLGFLGLGAQSPTPEWGSMLRDMIDLFFINPSMLILPGATILISVLIVNLLGGSIEQALSKEDR